MMLKARAYSSETKTYKLLWHSVLVYSIKMAKYLNYRIFHYFHSENQNFLTLQLFHNLKNAVGSA